MVVADVKCDWEFPQAPIEYVRAPGRKGAPFGQLVQGRRLALNGVQVIYILIDVGHRPYQRLGVGMGWVIEKAPHIGALYYSPGVHHRHPVAHLGHDAKVVGDKNDGEAGFSLQVF